MNTIKVAHTVPEQQYHVVAVGKHRLKRQWACEYIPLTEYITCPVCGKRHIVAPYIYRETEDKYDTPYEWGIWNDYNSTCSIDCAFSYRMQYRDILAPDTELVTYKQSWSDIRMEQLDIKGRSNWDEADWDSYNYIMGLRFESGYYDGQEY